MCCYVPLYCFFFFSSSAHHRDLHSFPTRRSSDLNAWGKSPDVVTMAMRSRLSQGVGKPGSHRHGDRKSTRLNSSHLGISYAVFCLKKKKKKNTKYIEHKQTRY